MPQPEIDRQHQHQVGHPERSAAAQARGRGLYRQRNQASIRRTTRPNAQNLLALRLRRRRLRNSLGHYQHLFEAAKVGCWRDVDGQEQSRSLNVSPL